MNLGNLWFNLIPIAILVGAVIGAYKEWREWSPHAAVEDVIAAALVGVLCAMAVLLVMGVVMWAANNAVDIWFALVKGDWA